MGLEMEFWNKKGLVTCGLKKKKGQYFSYY